MTTNFIGVLLPNSPNYTVNTGFSTELYDAEGAQTITVETGASLVLIGALGANTIRLAGSAREWQVYRDGSMAIAVRSDGSRVELPANTTAQTLSFSDGAFDLRVAVNGSTASVMLGTQVLGTTPAPIGDATLPGSVEKSAWTLVMTGSSGIYSSDGTAAGSGYVLKSTSYLGNGTVIANSNATSAVVLGGDKLYGTDGTAAGTSVLASTNNYYNSSYYRFGNKIVISDGGQSGPNGFVTDGTAAGTQVLADIPSDLVDTANQALWGAISTGPYGRELFKTTVVDGKAETVMVKDIAAGSASAMPYNATVIAALPDGRVVFTATDGSSGAEPWVSDGTAEGTYRLADLAPGSSDSNPIYMSSLGGKVLMIVTNVIQNNDYGSAHLVSTDGTPAGTKVLDMSFERFSPPQILGQVGDRLFFKASSTQAGGGSTMSIYSTDGNTIQKVADVGVNASMLGWSSEKAFFRVSDSAHGDELWVANFADGKFSLVKDILPGSGSALADVYSGSAIMAGGKLAFSAYTSASTTGFFLSDGTEQGTWQIGNQRPNQTVVVGNTMVFSDTEGLHAINLTGTKATVVQLPGSLGYQALQSDADQIYYLTSTGTLYAWNGTDAPQALSSNVAQFKVVAENAIYFTQVPQGQSPNLWFSDGSKAGTHYVSALPQDSFDLSRAAVLHTPGVAYPVENKAPVFASAAVNGATLTLSYSDDSPLDAAHLPAASAFQLEGTAATITAVTVDANARKVILTLSAPVSSNDVLKISYTDPSTANDSAALQDMHGNDAASFSGKTVQNLTADKEGPVLRSAVVDGATLTLSYSDANRLDASHLPDTGAFKLEGSTATITGVSVDVTGKKLVLSLSQPVASTDTLKLSYTDPSSGNDSAAVQDILGNDAASVTGQAVENKTAPPQAKAPWTLLVASNKGLFTSDGTAAGTKFVFTPQGSLSGKQLAVNADHSSAVFSASFYSSASGKVEYVLLGLDGSGNAPATLSNSPSYNSVPIVFGKYILYPDSSDTGGLITDGTPAGTHAVPNLKNNGTVDSAHQVIWNRSYSEPYGTELSITRVVDGMATISLVKDIWPGSSSGFGSSYPAPVLLEDGKLLFSGDDGSGAEPWISDGTDAGTVRLVDLSVGTYGSMPNSFVAFGHLVAFSASLSPSANTYLGFELVVTDGTAAGTKTFDINPGSPSSDVQMLGHIGETLYFSASVQSGNATTRALFSTDGASVHRLVDLSANAALLGSTGTKTFFSISDAAHGAELWVADAAKGTIDLVKDILPGTGSSLSGNLYPITVGGKLVFQAYTSASNQALFISDGSADGTIQLGGTLSANRTFGNMLVYADGSKVYGLDASAAAPAKVELTSGTSAVARMQADADQAFFSLDNGDLYATNGTANGTVLLGHDVKAFKVVAENALYIVEQVAGGTGYGLSYSDGTAAGTYFVGYVDSDLMYTLENSVVIQTVGVPPAH